MFHRQVLTLEGPVDLHAYDRAVDDGRRGLVRKAPHPHAPERPDYDRGYNAGCKAVSNRGEEPRTP